MAAGAGVEEAAAAVERRVVGPQLEGAAVVGDGLRQLTLATVGGGPADQRGDVRRVGDQRGRVVGDGRFVQVALDGADAVLAWRQRAEAVHDRAEVGRPGADGPAGEVVEEPLPRLR